MKSTSTAPSTPPSPPTASFYRVISPRDRTTLLNVRAVNADGTSPWTPLAIRTLDNPLEHAIRGIRGRSSAQDQAGFEMWHLFDFAESGDVYHSKYGAKAVPCSMTIDLVSVNNLDRMEYLRLIYNFHRSYVIFQPISAMRSVSFFCHLSPVPFTGSIDGADTAEFLDHLRR